MLDNRRFRGRQDKALLASIGEMLHLRRTTHVLPVHLLVDRGSLRTEIQRLGVVDPAVGSLIIVFFLSIVLLVSLSRVLHDLNRVRTTAALTFDLTREASGGVLGGLLPGRARGKKLVLRSRVTLRHLLLLLQVAPV